MVVKEDPELICSHRGTKATTTTYRTIAENGIRLAEQIFNNYGYKERAT